MKKSSLHPSEGQIQFSLGEPSKAICGESWDIIPAKLISHFSLILANNFFSFFLFSTSSFFVLKKHNAHQRRNYRQVRISLNNNIKSIDLASPSAIFKSLKPDFSLSEMDNDIFQPDAVSKAGLFTQGSAGLNVTTGHIC